MKAVYSDNNATMNSWTVKHENVVTIYNDSKYDVWDMKKGEYKWL